jgi:hypothetical protein
MSSSCKSEGCFIATAVYGSYDAPEVLVLRNFRDNTLSKTTIGMIFIRFYYAISPKFSRYVGGDNFITLISRKILDFLIKKII